MARDQVASDQVPHNGQGLKAVVIGLGLLLAICAMIVVGTIVYRLFNQAAPDAAGFGVSQLSVPAGCAIESASAEGDRLILRIGGSDHCRRVLVADLRTGALIGQFHFPPQ